MALGTVRAVSWSAQRGALRGGGVLDVSQHRHQAKATASPGCAACTAEPGPLRRL